ncbi:hypothetical protein KR100_11510 [Synechococcus sp. KORDI-100]|uniref:bifunctional cobalt-precorrin-7 (C(5))-methyltransferase/cobalt-precorrin-6B (C(15))-methyltransferase n=1 Tax=Synechococcus sp. KORDI-100 TaxID=1280380 RepID=UPI0004E051A3|nr:bifunctional cobalt-precorrin-7 (C(5))-methyltransferase/cobalt-precorrin-6B (C(15))-methyltransferase [Synechococcus sp. KORDI-100]AII43982.1 hypothetical protein KR100_11510 [Synechococcus sp. KORDI-100]
MIDVIGTDAGAPESLPAALQQLIRRAETVAAPIRQHPALAQWLDRPQEALVATDDPRALCDVLKREASAVVLASGDPLWFGIGRILQRQLGVERLRFHPSPTSLQLAFARLGRPWQDASWVSLHGRSPEPLAKALQKRPEALAVLTDPDQGGAETVRRTLLASDLNAAYQLWICENLGHPHEQVRRFDVAEPLPDDLSRLSLTVLIAETDLPPSPHDLPLFGIEDGQFLQHNDHPGLMTKREVRVQLLADLQLPERGVLWDIGAGTGSVGLEALRLRPQLQLLSVELRGGGAALIQANAKRLGVHLASVLELDARKLADADLPHELARPDRVLLGGGGRERAELLQVVLSRLKPEGVVVVPLATLEAVAECRPLMEAAGLTVGLSQVQAWRGVPLGDGTRLNPMNPAFILKGLAPTGHQLRR